VDALNPHFLARRAERATLFDIQRGTAEQHIKEGKNAVPWTRLSSHDFTANAAPLQLHALAYTTSSTSCASWRCPRRSAIGR